MTGNFTVAATMQFLGKGADHRKAGIMVRQSLDTGCDLRRRCDPWQRHARAAMAEQTRRRYQHVRSTFRWSGHVQCEAGAGPASGCLCIIGKDGAEPKEIAHTEVSFRNPVLVGLVVCSHEADASDTVVFSNVSVQGAPPAGRPPQPSYRSKISIYDMRDKSIRTVYQADTVFEAPNWTSDGKYLLINSGGKLYRLSVERPDATPEAINIDSTLRLNNDHAPSWDGK